MTRTTRRTVCAITLICVVVAVVIFFAWATSGFRNWDAATWFGNTQTEKVKDKDKPDAPEDPDAPVTASATAANAGIVYDSDDATATVEVSKLQNPSFAELLFDDIDPYIVIKDFNLGIEHKVHYKVTIDDDHSVVLMNEFKNNFANDIRINAVTELAESYGYGHYYMVFTWCESLTADYSDSSVVQKVFYVPEEVQVCPEMNIAYSYSEADSVVEVIMPYEYSNYTGSSDTHIAHLKIEVGYVDDNGAFLDNSSAYINNFSTAQSVYSKVIVSPGSGESRYKVKLALLPFINQLHPYGIIRVGFNLTVKGTMPVTVCSKYPDFAFYVSRLDSPTNIRQNGNYIEWNAVDGAQGYAVFTDAETTSTVTSDARIQISSLSAGTHTFRVRALGNVGKQLTESETSLASLTPYNASVNITQLAVINYSIDGEVVSKFVPVDGKLGDYLYDVKVPKKLFGGWYYDSGFTDEVGKEDKITGDITVFARLMDKEVTERPLSWWEKNKWYVLIPCFAVAGIALAVGGVLYAKKKKKAK